MAIVQEFDLNMIPDSAPVIVHVNQYDEGEGRFEIHLYDGNVPYVPSAGAEAIIQGTKPDGKGFDYYATLSGSTVTADVTKQMTAVAGVVRVQVVITEGDDVTGTFVFGMDVQKSGLPADTDMSASEYQIVEQMIEAAEEAEAVAVQSAEDAEAWAVGQRSGSDVPPTDPTYHNNSKYWAGKAHEELDSKADLVDGKVPSSQLPSYVDDVVEGYYYNSKFYEEAAHTTEITPETGKIYVDLSTDVTYRWSGSEYIALSNPDIANDAVTAITASTAEYPVPAANELLKVIIGKINKFLDDLKTKKADKVSSATNGNFAGLDSNGNLTDSGKKASDFASSSAGVPAGGTTGQVLAKASGTDYDTEWVNASGGSGGHTILNGSGTAMTQRGKLQFDGLDVTDNSGNDKTVVTAPTPDYVDAQYNNSTTYSKGMTCIEGNVRYRYKNSTATSGHRPPDATYWEVFSVSDQTNVCGKWTLLGTYKGTTSLSSYQVLPTQTLSNITVTDIINNYKAIAIVFLNYSSSQEGNDGYMPITSAIFPTDLVYYLPPRNNYAALYGWHISANAPCLIQVTFGNNNVVSVDTQVRTSTSTTYEVGFAIYGIK